MEKLNSLKFIFTDSEKTDVIVNNKVFDKCTKLTLEIEFDTCSLKIVADDEKGNNVETLYQKKRYDGQAFDLEVKMKNKDYQSLFNE